MRERDRLRFRAIVAEERARGASLTEAVERAYAWLLKPSSVAWP